MTINEESRSNMIAVVVFLLCGAAYILFYISMLSMTKVAKKCMVDAVTRLCITWKVPENSLQRQNETEGINSVKQNLDKVRSNLSQNCEELKIKIQSIPKMHQDIKNENSSQYLTKLEEAYESNQQKIVDVDLTKLALDQAITDAEYNKAKEMANECKSKMENPTSTSETIDDRRIISPGVVIFPLLLFLALLSLYYLDIVKLNIPTMEAMQHGKSVLYKDTIIFFQQIAKDIKFNEVIKSMFKLMNH